MASLIKQLSSFLGVGVIATAIHYALLVSLVEFGGVSPVPSALCGFTAGGIVSYGLNRRHTFESDRPHEEAAWRFALVASFAFALTYLFMRLFHEFAHWPYLLAQVVTTLIVMVWTFGANRLWTFRQEQ
ncbi:MAG: GtrA family protein [Beijerinckiaceae bacterium]